MEDDLGEMEDNLGARKGDLGAMEDNLGAMEDDLVTENMFNFQLGRFCTDPVLVLVDILFY